MTNDKWNSDNMKKVHDKILAVPTNVITGFLGVGKTSAILHLLKNKPVNERWAVLVNEFGEIGVDGSLFEGQYTEENGVYIQEVPGGCMCCASGVPMQIALNQLLLRSKPHRLLIEPTGLGHPSEVIQVLSNQYYKDILHLQKIITLVDARNLADKRYTEHETFNQQLAIADVVVGNKLDLYHQQDQEKLATYLSRSTSKTSQLYFMEHGQIQMQWLKGSTKHLTNTHHHANHSTKNNNVNTVTIPDCGFVKAVNQGEGFYSVGWRFVAKPVFNKEKLLTLLHHVDAIRVKAVIISEKGNYSFNITADGFTETLLKDCAESRIEIICTTIDENWQRDILATLMTDEY
jgi:G3E family GTPase